MCYVIILPGFKCDILSVAVVERLQVICFFFCFFCYIIHVFYCGPIAPVHMNIPLYDQAASVPENHFQSLIWENGLSFLDISETDCC